MQLQLKKDVRGVERKGSVMCYELELVVALRAAELA
jgi:hypothetical protein